MFLRSSAQPFALGTCGAIESVRRRSSAPTITCAQEQSLARPSLRRRVFSNAKNTNHFCGGFANETAISFRDDVERRARSRRISSGASESAAESAAESAEQSESAGRPPVGADNDADRLRTGRWRRLDSRSGCGCRGEHRWFRTDRHHPKRLDCRRCGAGWCRRIRGRCTRGHVGQRSPEQLSAQRRGRPAAVRR